LELEEDDQDWAKRCAHWATQAQKASRRRAVRERSKQSLILCGHSVSLRIEGGALTIRNGFTHYPQRQETYRFFKGELTIPPPGGRVMMTAAVDALPDDVRARAIELTRTFDDFTPDNDPHNEHDFGSFEIDDQKFIFKHDYYDKSMQYGSEDPGDPKNNTRPHDHARGRILRTPSSFGVWSSIHGVFLIQLSMRIRQTRLRLAADFARH
jgi:Protein of unknown function (DUF3768)